VYDQQWLCCEQRARCVQGDQEISWGIPDFAGDEDVAVKEGGTMATLYDRVVKGMEAALGTAQKSVEVLMEKAEDTAEVFKFRLEKARLEREISKKFAELGSKLYEKAVREGKEQGILQDAEVQSLIEDLKRMDRELAHTQARMEREMEKQTSAS
jgi:hypothetical protein